MSTSTPTVNPNITLAEMPPRDNIHFVTGDATYPQAPASEIKLIIHVCNDIGVWGAGFVMALSKRWAGPKKRYLEMVEKYRRDNKRVPLGTVQSVRVAQNLYVLNMIAQRGVGTGHGIPLDYDALNVCLQKVVQMANEKSQFHEKVALPISIHCPKFGAGLAGGDWDRILENIRYRFRNYGPTEVYVYEYAGQFATTAPVLPPPALVTA